MRYKRMISFMTAFAICMGLCGCQPKNIGQGAAENDTSETVISGENTDEKDAAELSCDTFKAPDRAFLEKCISEAENDAVYIKYDKSGNYEALGYDDMMSLVSYVSHRGEAVLSEDDDYSENFGGMDKLFDDNWNYVGKPAVYFGFGPAPEGYDPENGELILDKERTLEAAEYLFGVIENDPDIQSAMKNAMDSNVLYVGYSQYSIRENGNSFIEWAMSDILDIDGKTEFSGSNEDTHFNVTDDEIYELSDIDMNFTRPDRNFIMNAAESRDGYYLAFRLNDDGSFSVLNDDNLDQVMYGSEDLEYLKEMLSEEMYKEHAEAGIFEDSDIDSYEKYVEYLLDMFGYDSIEDIESGDDPAIYFIIAQSDKYNSLQNGDAEILTTAAEHLFDKFAEEPKIARAASMALKNGASYCGTASATDEGDGIISLEFGFDTMNNARYLSSFDDAEFFYREKLSLNGVDGFDFGGTFVPADTEYLCISSRGEYIFKALASDIVYPENAVICAVDYDSYRDIDAIYDIKLLSENLPKLKGLYMYQAEIENPEYLTELSELTELSYYPSVTDDDGYISADQSFTPDFSRLAALKKLYIFGNYGDYGFLKELRNVESISVKVDNVQRDQLDDIFACPNVTELEIYGCASDDPDLSGISALNNLRKLDIYISSLDFAHIAEVSSLEELNVREYGGGKNADRLGKLKNVRVMKLDSVECDDYGFLSEMSSLRELTISCIDNISNSDIEPLTDLEDLSLANNTGIDIRVIEKLPNLKTFFWDDTSGDFDFTQLNGSQSLENYGQLFGAVDSYEFLRKCPNLKSVTLLGVNGVPLDMSIFAGSRVEGINCNGTEYENLRALADVKTLKELSLSGVSEEDEDILYLKESLPDCDIVCADQAFSNMAD